MKKILFVSIICLICGCSSVNSDIKEIAGNKGKLCNIKEINVEKDFYKYTYEYYLITENVELSQKVTESLIKLEEEYLNDINFYKTWGTKKDLQEARANFEKTKIKVDSCINVTKEYISKWENIEKNGIQNGKIYVGKFKVKNKYSGKYEDYYTYQLFTYNTDGNMYAVSPEDRYQIILSAYPNAKEDLRKCLSNNITDVINELSNIFNN